MKPGQRSSTRPLVERLEQRRLLATLSTPAISRPIAAWAASEYGESSFRDSIVAQLGMRSEGESALPISIHFADTEYSVRDALTVEQVSLNALRPFGMPGLIVSELVEAHLQGADRDEIARSTAETYAGNLLTASIGGATETYRGPRARQVEANIPSFALSDLQASPYFHQTPTGETYLAPRLADLAVAELVRGQVPATDPFEIPDWMVDGRFPFQTIRENVRQTLLATVPLPQADSSSHPQANLHRTHNGDSAADDGAELGVEREAEGAGAWERLSLTMPQASAPDLAFLQSIHWSALDIDEFVTKDNVDSKRAFVQGMEATPNDEISFVSIHTSVPIWETVLPPRLIEVDAAELRVEGELRNELPRIGWAADEMADIGDIATHGETHAQSQPCAAPPQAHTQQPLLAGDDQRLRAFDEFGVLPEETVVDLASDDEMSDDDDPERVADPWPRHYRLVLVAAGACLLDWRRRRQRSNEIELDDEQSIR